MGSLDGYNLGILSDNIVKSFGLYNQIIDIIKDKDNKSFMESDQSEVWDLFGQLINKLYLNPERLVELQLEFSSQYMDILNNITNRFAGKEEGPIHRPNPKDKRFNDKGWEANLYFDFLKQYYLMYSKWIDKIITQVEFEDFKLKRKLDFYIRQFLDAVSPSNFAVTNPQVIKEIVNTNGENIVKGMEQLLYDIRKSGNNTLNISTTDQEGFVLGKNIAATKGKVIFQNDLIQLIHYSPLKEKNFEVPILIVPPCINKYYILDLSEKNSFVKWLLEQGFSVFMISWVNPGKELAYKDFNNYILEGPLAALDAIQAATNKSRVSAIGYCVGGVLLASALAYLNKRGDKRIVNATFLTTLTDYTDPGELAILIDENQLKYIEVIMQKEGYLDGENMSAAFNLIRANEMIWSFYISNYLMGKEPTAFDVLYWNSDNTRLPATMYRDYLRNIYLDNLLKEPGGINFNGTPLNLAEVNIPLYMLSAKSDHIVPWQSSYKATQIFRNNIKFVLTTSGHVAGVVNHPSNKKYSYFVNDKMEKDGEEWLKNAQEFQGSWWENWLVWNVNFAGNSEEALLPEKGKLKIIEEAPGTYVKIK